jgi:radical SAM protein with 4Fe4S-binding SPASM domain
MQETPPPSKRAPSPLQGGEGNPYVAQLPETQWDLFVRKFARETRIDIELTERCNNNCIHCYINKPANDRECMRREMSTAQVKDILQQAADLGKVRLLITGGEPLLRKDFTEIYETARRLGLRVQLFTNGTLITPKLADLFARIPPLEKIEISVYGMSPESYEAVTRNPGSFRAFRRGVALLWERGVRFMLKMPVLAPNKHELQAFEEWCDSMPGTGTVKGFGALYKKRTRRDSDEKDLAIEGLRESPEEIVSIIHRRADLYTESVREFCSKYLGPPGELLFRCGAGLGGCVDAYGWLQPCMALRHPDCVVDLSKHTIREALTQIYPEMRERRAENAAYLASCAKCFIKPLCEQCPGTSWSENGTLDTPIEYLCQVAHAQARDLGLLQEGEQAWDVPDWQARLQAFIDDG